jgi:hypothetical protein
MSLVSFDATKEEYATIGLIAERAHELAASAGFDYPTMDAEMDVTATHANGCPLDLGRLLAFDDANFGHDVFGIRRFIDRSTGELTHCFLPRCSKPEETTP